MGDGGQKTLVVVVVLAFLLGLGVVFFNKDYTVEKNQISNLEYYPNVVGASNKK